MNLETPAVPLPSAQAESLSPANLPSWVQAMRPVEASGTPAFSGAAGEEDTLETQGPLAGLRGVLPSLPYLAPASKPQAQSFKLQASSEQQNHGALLELILQSETHPAPMSVVPRVAAQKGLRIAHLLTACVDEFSENEDLPNTTNPDDWARISGKKGERIVYIRTLVSGKHGTEAGRSIDTVANTGQYL